MTADQIKHAVVAAIGGVTAGIFGKFWSTRYLLKKAVIDSEHVFRDDMVARVSQLVKECDAKDTRIAELTEQLMKCREKAARQAAIQEFLDKNRQRTEEQEGC